MNDTELLDALDDLARHVAEPDSTIDLTARAVDQLGAWPTARTASSWHGRRLLAVAAAVVTVLVAVVPPVRAAVADVLGLGGIRITMDGSPSPGVDAELDLGRPVSVAVAMRLAPGPLSVPDEMGRPAAAFVGRPPGGVSLVWSPTDELPEVLDHGIGLLVTAFPGTLEPEHDVIAKQVFAGGTIEPTSVGGERAFWLAGDPHGFLYVDEDGRTREDAIRLSGNTLIWESDGVTYRLESALSLFDAVPLAESLVT